MCGLIKLNQSNILLFSRTLIQTREAYTSSHVCACLCECTDIFILVKDFDPSYMLFDRKKMTLGFRNMYMYISYIYIYISLCKKEKKSLQIKV